MGIFTTSIVRIDQLVDAGDVLGLGTSLTSHFELALLLGIVQDLVKNAGLLN